MFHDDDDERKDEMEKNKVRKNMQSDDIKDCPNA